MNYHIVGIAGAGMSAIAHVLLDQGHTVSGSDLQRNALSDALAARGATIFTGHDAAHIAGAEALVVTSAVKRDHPELRAASERGIPVLKRADLWREWSSQRDVVAVAGTHGKTTTTAMIALVLTRAGRDPGYLIGGEAPDLPRNARWGDPQAPLVIEADEYDRTFLALTPRVALITNVEWDHVDIYRSPEEYDAAFGAFAGSVRSSQDLIICGDDAGALRVAERPDATQYGIDDAVASDPVSCRRALLDWMAANARSDADGTTFDVWRYDRRSFATYSLGPCRIQLSGSHNIRNALAALAATSALGVAPEQTIAALAEYRGTRRRFELKGEAGGVTVIDDYAHHPTEVRATLAAARERYPGRRIVVYLQPHTYSRTAALLDTWAGAFGDPSSSPSTSSGGASGQGADVVRIGEIYAAREGDTLGIDSATLARRLDHPDSREVGGMAHAVEELQALLQPGDVLLTLGAGDGYLVGEKILEKLRVQSEKFKVTN
jgi:UDP-N-acetylmuramate--alanine ligase